jgi:hypothetical protein
MKISNNAGVAERFQKCWCGREILMLVWQGEVNADVAWRCQYWCGREIAMLMWQGDVNAGVAGRCQCWCGREMSMLV